MAKYLAPPFIKVDLNLYLIIIKYGKIFGFTFIKGGFKFKDKRYSLYKNENFVRNKK